MDVRLGTLKPYDLREIWQYEDRHFTVWLSENIERLGKALGVPLEFRRREHAIGPFSLDILAHDTLRDRVAIIENQLEKTDHDHLGKLLTYAAGLDAAVIIWIAPTFREQHRAAIDWLNRSTDENVEFFGVELEAVQIDDSLPAINFKVVASPNEWEKIFSQREQVGAPEGDSRALYFYQFNEALITALAAKGTYSQLPVPAARYETVVDRTQGGAVRYGTAFSRDVLRVVTWIVFNDRARNVQLFNALQSRRAEIEARLSAPVKWDFNPDRLGQIIEIDLPATREPDRINIDADTAAEAINNLRAVLDPMIASIVSEIPASTQPTG